MPTALAYAHHSRDGIRCASAIRQAVQGLDLQIRAGVHAGEVEVRGDDLTGIAVHIASRIESNADPSEVLVSSTVKDLVAGSDIRFQNAVSTNSKVSRAGGNSLHLRIDRLCVPMPSLFRE